MQARLRFGNLIPVLGIAIGLGLGVHGVGFWGADPLWAKKLLLAAAVIVVGAAIVLRLQPELKTNLSLSATTVVLCLFAIETLLAARACTNARELPESFDRRTATEVVRDLRAAGKEVVPALFATYAAGASGPDDLMPLAGISTATTVFCNESGTFVLYKSDEHGFNNPSGLPSEAEVIILGDSFAHGQCVEPGQDLASLLRKKGHPTVNLGCAGNGPLAALATWVEYGVAHRPKVVLWLYYETDLVDLVVELQQPAMRRYLDERHTQRLFDRQPEIDAYWKRYLTTQPDADRAPRARAQMAFEQVLTLHNLRRVFGLRRADQGNMSADLSVVLDLAKRRIEGAGAKLVIVYLPTFWSIHDVEPAGPRRTLIEVAGALGLPVVDFAAVLAKDEDPERFYPLRQFGHFNADGYVLMAETILGTPFLRVHAQ